MADSADVKPKILSTSEIDDMVAKQKQLKEATPEMMYKSGHPGSMTRPSKLFIKVDSEGLLTDTIAISDVVDFDCYESIVSSACRIIACFQNTKPQNIEVESLFYYKKRARSTRMNPVMIKSTTDAFKAVAEHPVGEVPIGVRWSQKLKYRFTTNGGKTKIQNVSDLTDQGQKAQPVHIAPKPNDSTEAAAPEKKRKIQEDTVMVVQAEPKNQIPNATSHISPFNQAYPVISSEAFKGINKTTSLLQLPVNKSNLNKGKDEDTEAGESEEKSEPSYMKYMPRQAPDHQYMFPKEARTELVVTYGDGVVEKRKLTDDIVKVVTMMLKGNYSYLTREAQIAIGVGANAGGLQSEEKTQERQDNYPTGTSRSGIIQFENEKPIRYIKDAKSEIFRILSMLSVSKTRFKSLLKWMKTLKLEDGKKGKYFLSARDIIGGAKFVISSGFETDEQNVLKHDQTYRPYGSIVTQGNEQNVLKHDQTYRPYGSIVTHSNGPGDSGSKQITVPAIPEPPHNQIMFLMPTSTIPGSATPVFKTSTGVTMVPTSKVIHVPVQPTSLSSTVSTSSSIKNVDTLASVTTPHILRRRPRKSSQPTKSRDASPNPIPMSLYRSYHTDDDRLSPPGRSSEKESSLSIKTEPHDYDSETSDAALDYDRNSDREVLSPRQSLHSGAFSPDSVYSDSVTNNYDKRKVLRSDAAMPLSTEVDKPFDIVIKSEPLDYE